MAAALGGGIFAAAAAARLLARYAFGASLEHSLQLSTPLTAVHSLRECIFLWHQGLNPYHGPHCRRTRIQIER